MGSVCGSLTLFVFLAVVLALTPPISYAQESSSKQQHSSPKSPKSPASSRQLDLGTLRDGVYRNSAFGFSYKLPVSWVDRTEDMRQDSPSEAPSQLLLSAFSRPPEAAGETINSAVIIAAEEVAAYPGLKRAVDYFEPLTQAATSKGFRVVNEPYEFPIGTRVLVRSDFTKEEGPQKMYQSSLAILDKGYAVSFTFVAATEEDAAELLKNLSFAGPTRPKSTK